MVGTLIKYILKNIKLFNDRSPKPLGIGILLYSIRTYLNINNFAVSINNSIL